MLNVLCKHGKIRPVSVQCYGSKKYPKKLKTSHLEKDLEREEPEWGGVDEKFDSLTHRQAQAHRALYL